MKPFEDIEWVEQRREFVSGLLDASTTPSEAAEENYRLIQAQWMLDHVKELERVDPELAAEVHRMSERGGFTVGLTRVESPRWARGRKAKVRKA